ncbi:hypothetical protein chiPu_0005873, partial [Chiloscyllium punctatum]|nr:hypothetical protein [Chiloscyllium punctatum]
CKMSHALGFALSKETKALATDPKGSLVERYSDLCGISPYHSRLSVDCSTLRWGF